MQEKSGGAGVFHYPQHEHFMLKKPEWKYDEIPQIMDGMVVWDYYSPDIVEKLNELEKEEAILEA